MERIFTKETGRFKRGDIRDYPVGVWRGIAKSTRKPLDSFTALTSDKAKEAVGAGKRR